MSAPKPTTKLLINGALVDGEASPFDVVNPSTGEAFASCPAVSQDQAEAAVQAAHNAFPKWSSTTLAQRQQHLAVARDAFGAAKDELAELLVKEQGKPLASAQGEIDACVNLLFKLAIEMTLPVEVYKDTETMRIETRKAPIGVIACITPWNFPLFIATQKIAPALAVGNTVIVKPSPFTPLTTVRLGELLAEAFPPGVINVITAKDDQQSDFNLGQFLTDHPLVRKVSFTGSIATGKRINTSAAPDMKRVTLECGGNDAAIVRADADVAAAAKGVVGSAFANTGQLCCAAKRAYVHESVFDEFVAEAKKAVLAQVHGDGFKHGVTHGPIQNAMQFERVSDIVADAKANGATIVCGGSPVNGATGYFFQPTLVTGVKEGVRLVDEEQFGPVLPIMPYSTDDEAIARANNTMFGLGGSVWGTDLAKANAMAARVDAGTVWVNAHSDLTGAPFGGFKWSGVGRELGKADIEAFTETKTLQLAK